MVSFRIGAALLLVGCVVNASQAATLLFSCNWSIGVFQEAEAAPPAATRDRMVTRYFLDAATGQMLTQDGDAIWAVEFYRGIEALSIVQERNIGGNVSTVTIVVAGPERGRAVYSRITMSAGGHLMPQQRYGRCEHSGLVPVPERR